MTTMVRRALDRMLNPRSLPAFDTLHAEIDRTFLSAADAEITRLRARIAELERERDGLIL